MKVTKVKKITAVLCALICAIGSTFICSAASQRYTINEIDDMVIYLPDDMTAITRSSQNTDRYFSVFGLNYDTTMQNFKNGDIYLQGMDSMSSVTVTVTMTKTADSNSIGNYNLLEADKLSQVSSNFLSQSEYTSCTPDMSGKIVWLNFDTNVTSNGLSIRAYQANTVYDGMSVSITLQRNSGNVTPEDYATFTEIVSSVSFLKESSIGSMIPYIIIGASVFVILLIIILIIIVKHIKKRRKKNRNDRILEELAGKYTSKRRSKPAQENSEYSVYEDEKFEESENDSEEEYRIDKTEIDSEDFFKGVEQNDNEDVKIYKSSERKIDDSEIEEILNFKRMSDKKAAAESEESLAEVVYSNANHADNEDKTETKTETEIEDTEESAEPETAEEAPTEEVKEKTDMVAELEDGLFGEADENDEEDYNNDEELVREEAKRVKFRDSDDFFEEAPKKTMGVISSKDIRDAEDFDVINEVEERVKEVEKPSQNAGKSFVEAMKKVGGGIKSFVVHCGYFCTNVSRMIKRKHAMKKRQKAEAERRERARQRAERQSAQRREMENGGLVRVHSRSESRPAQNRRPVQQRRPSSQQRRPSNPQNRNNRRR
ncbi:hypothetical protein [Ruminococcus sp.]|uniref:hypothetical protein n=1 Tax=Ruminococcus sp. TaxID=41978 RepID=UPI0025DBE417|nr:hypothetical protein [Ruminococcus sp.]MCI6616314.1 hypothetical protein [Ruminococcus sp.]